MIEWNWLLGLDSNQHSPVNRRKQTDLPGVAEMCRESPKREIEPDNTGAIDAQSVARVSRGKRRLVVPQGQRRGTAE